MKRSKDSKNIRKTTKYIFHIKTFFDNNCYKQLSISDKSNKKIKFKTPSSIISGWNKKKGWNPYKKIDLKTIYHYSLEYLETRKENTKKLI